MQEFEIRLHSVQDVEEFASLATTRSFPVFVSDGFHRVSGKSFLEMFCLDLSRCLLLTVDCSDLEFQEFRQDAARFLTTE